MRSENALRRILTRGNADPEQVPDGERAPVRRPGKSTPTRITPIRPLPRIPTEPVLGPGQGPSPHAPRVLVVAPQPFYEDRGTPIAVRQLIQALGHIGYGVDLVTYPIGKTIDIPGLNYYRTSNLLGIKSVPIGFSLRKLALDITLTATLVSRLRSRRYAFIHAVEEAAFPAVAMGRLFGVPVVYDMQSSLPEQMLRHPMLRHGLVPAFMRGCERWLLRRADVIIASTGLAERVSRIAPNARVREWRFSSPVSSVPPDEVLATRRSLDIPDGAPVVMYSGTFEQYQGLDLLLDALPRVLKRVDNTVLVLVGAQGAEGKTVKERAAALRLNGSLRIVDRQPRDRIPQYLAMADVLVSPRMYGGNLPLKIFDYLAAGRPIVATDIPTHRTLLDDSLAVLVRPREKELAGALVEVLTDRDHAARLAESARHFALQHLGWMAFVQAVSDFSHTVSPRG
ncbi:MAG TPA: glycosyltransferase family 4 protein [Gemmatimonadaceae bacterium]|nr:glycosyltransferase family 4 protein [Gemmatimonadaceae bacterium]